MTEVQQPDALRLADWCDANSSGAYRASAEAAAELRRQHAQIAAIESDRSDIYRRLGDQILRANQMTEQHRMQCNIRAGLEAQAALHSQELRAYRLMVENLVAVQAELITAAKEVLRISWRKHDAWDAAIAAIGRAEGGVP